MYLKFVNILDRLAFSRDVSDGYIKDGLIHYLKPERFDGVKWVDVIGGVEFANNGAFALDGGVYFDGSSYCESPNGLGNVKMIEIVFKGGAITASRRLFVNEVIPGSITGVLELSASRGFAAPYEGQPAYSFITQNSQDKRVLSISDTIAILNKTNLSSRSPGTFQISDVVTKAYIGGRYLNQYNLAWNGYIYAVRMYNRELTYEEIIHNQNIDNSIYGLGLV